MRSWKSFWAASAAVNVSRCKPSASCLSKCGKPVLNRVGARVAKDRIGASRAVLRAIVEEVAADVGAEIGRDVTQILKLGRKELGRVRRLSNTTRRGAKLRTRVQQHQTRRQSEATQGGATHGDATQAGATPQSHFDMTALCSAIDEKNGTEARSEAEEKHQGM